MELSVRLTAKDVNTDGVFDALERLCLCFASERNIVIAPPENKAEKREGEAAGYLPGGGGQEALEQVPSLNKAPKAQTYNGTTGTASSNISVGTAVKPVQQPAQQQTQPPVRPPVVPTAQPGFDRMQISQAAVRFAESSDSARLQVVDVINSFGVKTLIEVPEERLGELATKLRGIGVHI